MREQSATLNCILLAGCLAAASAFAADPENTSVPLVNCFELAGIGQDDIAAQVAKLKTDPAEINNLQEKLGDKVTTHIKKVWPNQDRFKRGCD